MVEETGPGRTRQVEYKLDQNGKGGWLMISTYEYEQYFMQAYTNERTHLAKRVIFWGRTKLINQRILPNTGLVLFIFDIPSYSCPPKKRTSYTLLHETVATATTHVAYRS